MAAGGGALPAAQPHRQGGAGAEKGQRIRPQGAQGPQGPGQLTGRLFQVCLLYTSCNGFSLARFSRTYNISIKAAFFKVKNPGPGGPKKRGEKGCLLSTSRCV